MKNLINRALVAKKRLFCILAAVLVTAGVKATNYRVDSVYHYYSFNEKAVVDKTIYHYNSDGKTYNVMGVEVR